MRHDLAREAGEKFGVVVINLEGRVLSANHVAEDLLSANLAPGLNIRGDERLADLFLGERSLVAQTLEQGLMRSGVLTGEGLPREGLLFWSLPLFEGYDKVVGAVVTLVGKGEADVSAGLKFLQLTHEDIMDNLPEGVFVVNTRLQITYINRAAQKITGFSEKEVLGKLCWEVFRSSHCKKGCPLQTTMTTGESLQDREITLTTKSGEKKLIVVSTSLIREKNNIIQGCIQVFRDMSGLRPSPDAAASRYIYADIVGNSPQMKRIFSILPEIASTDTSVLIQGEFGTGKELVARAVHQGSPRKDGPFVAVNCSALTETLLASELFGHERGSFTGAISTKVGRFELAKGGTLFLDEIAEVKPEIQVKLLRVLEDKSFERVGGTRKIAMEARIIAATNRNLSEAIKEGSFRDDLYFRLSTVPIYLPPLRERPGDIPLLVQYLIEKFNTKLDKNVRGIDPKVLRWFCKYSWPGNVRELEHVIEYCFVFVKGRVITERHLPPKEDGTRYGEEIEFIDTGLSPLQEAEKSMIIKALEVTGGKRQEAAEILQISRGSLWRKMRLYNINYD